MSFRIFRLRQLLSLFALFLGRWLLLAGRTAEACLRMGRWTLLPTLLAVPDRPTVREKVAAPPPFAAAVDLPGIRWVATLVLVPLACRVAAVVSAHFFADSLPL